MAFFTSHTSAEELPDFTAALRDPAMWKTGVLRQLDLAGHVAAMAVDAVLGIMAIGTSKGSINIYGAPASTIRLVLRNARPKFLAFAQTASKLICVGSSGPLFIDWQ